MVELGSYFATDRFINQLHKQTPISQIYIAELVLLLHTEMLQTTLNDAIRKVLPSRRTRLGNRLGPTFNWTPLRSRQLKTNVLGTNSSPTYVNCQHSTDNRQSLNFSNA